MTKVCDDYDWFGIVNANLPNGIGVSISDLESQDGDAHPGKIDLINLKALIKETFQISERPATEGG